jgi:hypothetical protein
MSQAIERLRSACATSDRICGVERGDLEEVIAEIDRLTNELREAKAISAAKDELAAAGRRLKW